MKIKILFIVIIFLNFLNSAFGQAIYENRITRTNPDPGEDNPYTNGQTFNPNIAVSGISRGGGLFRMDGNDRYNADDWDSSSLNSNDYFEFTLSPKPGYQINYTNFVYKAQVSATGPLNFVFRSSIDNYTTNIAIPSIVRSASEETPIPIDLSGSAFQNSTTAITFRFYGWNAGGSSGTFSINDFIFNGVVSCAKPATPIIGPVTQPNCTVDKGTIELQGLPRSGSWNLYQNDVLIVTGGSGSTKTVSGLSAGNYSYKVSAGTSCSSLASAAVAIASLTTKWKGDVDKWSNGLPTSSKTVVIDANYTTDASHPNIVACSLTINSPYTLTIGSQYFLTIQNNLTVATGATLNITNQGSLVMISDSGAETNNGTINVSKTTMPFEKSDYTYWSSPITSTPISSTAGTTFAKWRSDHAYYFEPLNFSDLNLDGFDDDQNDWVGASTMNVPGKGYIIMGPTWLAGYPATASVVFTANVPTNKLNNGSISVPIALTPGAATDDDWNLIGNPYPCAISADALIKANISSTSTINKTIDGTLYFWTHKKNIEIASLNPGPDAYNYSQDDYAVYTLAGGVGTSGSLVGGVIQSNKPLGFIASGQGFFVEAAVAGNLTFNNAMRVSPTTIIPCPDTANTQFYKRTAVKERTKAKDRVWLNLENKIGMFSQQLIGYFDNATDDVDNGYDGLLNDGGNYINFYSFINDGTYKIQGRKAFNDSDELRLGYFSAVTGTFNINIDSKEGVFKTNANAVFLEDKLLGILHNLKKGAYSFTTESGTFDNRFVLRYTDKTLGNEIFKKEENTVLVSAENKQITINSPIETIDAVQVYDLSGRSIYQKTDIGSNELTIPNAAQSHQVLIVKTMLQNGQMLTNKIVY